jgi:hypothetical protein
MVAPPAGDVGFLRARPGMDPRLAAERMQSPSDEAGRLMANGGHAPVLLAPDPVPVAPEAAGAPDPVAPVPPAPTATPQPIGTPAPTPAPLQPAAGTTAPIG